MEAGSSAERYAIENDHNISYIYTITYNANDGTGAPTSQTKLHGTNITLSDIKPTRSGYRFVGWATTADGEVAYAAGETYTVNESCTLHAVWKRIVTTHSSVVNNIVMVTPTNAQVGDCMIVACYKGNRMVYVDTYSYNGATTVPFVPDKAYDTIKIMVWESLSNMKPLSDVEII